MSYQGSGESLQVTAPHDVKAGDGLSVRNLFVFVLTNAKAGAEVAARTSGVFVKRARGDIKAGEPVTWNAKDRCVEAGTPAIGLAVSDSKGGHVKMLLGCGVGDVPSTPAPKKPVTAKKTEVAPVAEKAAEKAPTKTRKR